MIFSNNFNFLKPSQEEIRLVKRMAIENPELLDSRELWILKNQPDFSDDTFGEGVVE